MANGEQEATIRNGWHLKCFSLFLQRLQSLTELVGELERDDPQGFHHHPATKLMMSVWNAVEFSVPADPNAAQFRCATLGHGGKWRRVKQGLPQRYRLFFQFSSTDRSVLYVWLNDEGSLRKAGARTDVYAVFLAMVKQGKIPSSYSQLLQECQHLPDQRKATKQ